MTTSNSKMEPSRPSVASPFGPPRRAVTAPTTIPASSSSSFSNQAGSIEELYVHPSAKIVSFTAGSKRPSSISRSSAGSQFGEVAADDEDEPGTLAWSSQLERTIAIGMLNSDRRASVMSSARHATLTLSPVGPFRIYRAPGSVAFLNCGTALKPILPKSQCWAVDEESSKFVLRIRRPQYWRIELPVSDDGDRQRVENLRAVFDAILQFEKTPCPFRRSFTVELPERPQTPIRYKPWTPKRRPVVLSPPDSAESSPTKALEIRKRQRQGLREEMEPPTPITPQETAETEKEAGVVRHDDVSNASCGASQDEEKTLTREASESTDRHDDGSVVNDGEPENKVLPSVKVADDVPDATVETVAEPLSESPVETRQEQQTIVNDAPLPVEPEPRRVEQKQPKGMDREDNADEAVNAVDETLVTAPTTESSPIDDRAEPLRHVQACQGSVDERIEPTTTKAKNGESLCAPKEEPAGHVQTCQDSVNERDEPDTAKDNDGESLCAPKEEPTTAKGKSEKSLCPLKEEPTTTEKSGEALCPPKEEPTTLEAVGLIPTKNGKLGGFQVSRSVTAPPKLFLAMSPPSKSRTANIATISIPKQEPSATPEPEISGEAEAPSVAQTVEPSSPTPSSDSFHSVQSWHTPGTPLLPSPPFSDGSNGQPHSAQAAASSNTFPYPHDAVLLQTTPHAHAQRGRVVSHHRDVSDLTVTPGAKEGKDIWDDDDEDGASSGGTADSVSTAPEEPEPAAAGAEAGDLFKRPSRADNDASLGVPSIVQPFTATRSSSSPRPPIRHRASGSPTPEATTATATATASPSSTTLIRRRPALSPLPSAANLFSPSSSVTASARRRRQREPRRLGLAASAQSLPMAVVRKTCEILLSPPGYLISLMLRVAARIAAGEWRGLVFGEGGERVVWGDYSSEEEDGSEAGSDDFALDNDWMNVEARRRRWSGQLGETTPVRRRSSVELGNPGAADDVEGKGSATGVDIGNGSVAEEKSANHGDGPVDDGRGWEID